MTLEFCLLVCLRLPVGVDSLLVALWRPLKMAMSILPTGHIQTAKIASPLTGERKKTNKKKNSAFWLKKICVRIFRGEYTARGAKPRAPLPLRSSHKSKHLLPHVVSLRRSEAFLQLRRHSHPPEVVATTVTSVTDGRVHRRRTLLQKTPQKRTTRRFQTSSAP